MVIVSTFQDHTYRFQQVSIELWGHWEWRAYVPVLAGIYREDERRQLATWLDELGIPLRPLLSVVRLQGTQEPAQSHLNEIGLGPQGAKFWAASANCSAKSNSRSCTMQGEILTCSHRPHQTVHLHQST